MASRRVVTTTLGVLLSLFLGSMEATVVATAMPTIVSDLGGLEIYSWVFSAYMLASTTTVPIYGKLSDQFGRRPVFTTAMILFLAGSILSGFARSMPHLVAFRAVQGLGAGGLLPLAFIIVGDLFNFEQRARVQALFSGVWGVSSVVGPLLGGFLVDVVGWPWVFFINVLPGVIAWMLVSRGLRETSHERTRQAVPVDYAGAALLAMGVVALLLGLFEVGTTTGWILLGSAAVLFVALGLVERRAPEPILPLSLFRDRLFAVACLHGLLAGSAVFGSASFVPLFAQAVLGVSATAAGATLTPQLIGWVLASIVGSRLLLRVGYRALALSGMVVLTIGAFPMSRIGADTRQVEIMAYLALMGVGMGLSIPAFLLAVQNSVQRERLGTATATVQFARSMGGALGVSIMGVILGMRLASGLREAGVDPESVSVNSLLDPLGTGGAGVATSGALQKALAGAIASVFLLAFAATVLALVATALAPGGQIRHLAAAREGGSPTSAPPTHHRRAHQAE